MQFCDAMLNFDKKHDIHCLHAEFVAKHTKDQLSLTTHWNVEHYFGSRQSPNISHYHVYCITIPWTPPTTIYREYIVLHLISICVYFRRCTVFSASVFIPDLLVYAIICLLTHCVLFCLGGVYVNSLCPVTVCSFMSFVNPLHPVFLLKRLC